MDAGKDKRTKEFDPPVSKVAATLTWSTKSGDSKVVDPVTGKTISVNGAPVGDANERKSGNADA